MSAVPDHWLRAPTRGWRCETSLPGAQWSEEAEDRAFRLLCSFLSEKQRRKYAFCRQFEEDIGHYMVRLDASLPHIFNVLDKHGNLVGTRGIHAINWAIIPPSDSLLSILLLLRTDLAGVDASACGTPRLLTGPTHWWVNPF